MRRGRTLSDRYALPSLLFLSIVSPGSALDAGKAITQYVHDVWQIEQGLPQNSVTSIVQTRDGYLWLGTHEGLVRFDGVRFSVFDSTNTPEIKNKLVRCLREDREGNLWIGTDGGLYRFRNGEFKRFTTREGLANDQIYAVTEDHEGALWIGTYGGGLNRLKNGEISTFTSGEGISSDFVYSLHADREGSVWIGTYGGGLNRLKNGKVTSFTTEKGLSNDLVYSIHEDPEGSLWIGTYGGGLNRLKDGKFTVLTTKDGLSSDFVYALYEDREGSLWIGTEKGLNRYRDGKFSTFTKSGDLVFAIYEDVEGSLWVGTHGGGLNRFRDGNITTYTAEEGLSDDYVYSIYENRRGEFWIGTRGGLNRFKDGKFTSFTTREGLSNDVVFSIEEDHTGTLWIGTYGGGVNRLKDGKFSSITTRDGLANDFVYCIHEDRQGNLWFGTRGGGLNRLRNERMERFTTGDGLSSDFVYSILEDRQGVLWFGTRGGLTRFANGKFTSYTTKEGLSSSLVYSIYEDRSGTLWLGTNGGLNRFQDGAFSSFTTREGMFDDVVFSVTEDSKENLWMSCNKGIFRISKKDLNRFVEGKATSIPAVAFGTADGMKSRECNGGGHPAVLRSRDGRLWFPTIAGVAMIDPENMRINPFPPPVAIEMVIADRESFTNILESKILPAFDPGKEKLEFHYTALSLLIPERVRFQYRLEGFDKNWVHAETRRAAYYTNIPPGNYTFHVRACNNDGVWNETGARLSFQLRPYFYQTLWFYAACILAVIGGFAGAYKLRIRRLKVREQELARLVEERTSALKKQTGEAEKQKDLAEKEKERAEKATAIVERQAKKLMEADQIKSRFFANISHEFRTPLTLNLGPLENALSGVYGETSPELRKQHEIMLRNSRRLLRLINQLLDISRLEAGQMELRARRQNLTRFSHEIISLFVSMAERKKITLQLNCAEDLELYFDTDKMEKIFSNLLSNAMKFTPEKGKILVSISEEGATGFVRISVKDTGIGISGADLSLVFDRFRQVGHPLQEHSGSGIGLSLVKDLVTLHGGTVDVRSEPGFGSEFIVLLPKGKQHLRADQLAEQEGPRESPAASRNFEWEAESEFFAQPRINGETASPEGESALDTVLIVEDNRDVRDYIRSCLPGYRIIEAKDGEEALEKARECHPDLILSDVMMPRMDGYRLLQTLKSDSRLQHIPVILLTAKASEETRLEGLEAGADDYLSKPFNAKELKARVKNLIRIRRQEKELIAFNEELERKVKEQLDALLRSRRLSRYLPSQIVERILSSEQEDLPIERKNVTVLVCNISGFLELTDRLEAEKLKSLLDEYLTEMMELMKKHGATPGGILGDTTLAFFGAPADMDPQKQAENAVSMAQAMQEKMTDLGGRWLAQGLDHEMKLRIGINQDYVTVGNIGSEDLKEYTVLGRGVNLAMRLNLICVPGRILVSFPVYAQTREHFPYEEISEHRIFGFSGLVRIYELGMKKSEVSKDTVKGYRLKECPVCGFCYEEFVEVCIKDGTRLSGSLPVDRTVENKYRLERLIGKGGMGAVYEGTDVRLHRKVAIKIMIENLSKDPVALTRFEREARLCAGIRHPNIITIHDYGMLGSEGAYLVMEYLQGSTLREELKSKGRLTPLVCAEWFHQICEGLKSAHHLGIIHRDLKPENILISREGPDIVMKILDFGLAKKRAPELSDPHTLSVRGAVFGTLSYMSPEQLDGEEVDERSDIFSLGVMAVECLTGLHPFAAENSPLLMASIFLKQYHIPISSDSHRQLDAVLQRCLAKDREDRFSTVAGMQEELIPAMARCAPFPDNGEHA